MTITVGNGIAIGPVFGTVFNTAGGNGGSGIIVITYEVYQ